MEETAGYNMTARLERIREQGNLDLYELVRARHTVVACTLNGHYIQVNRDDVMQLLEKEPFRYLVLEEGDYMENDITVVLY